MVAEVTTNCEMIWMNVVTDDKPETRMPHNAKAEKRIEEM